MTINLPATSRLASLQRAADDARALPAATLDLDERIAAAFQDGATSIAVCELIKEAETAAKSAGEAADKARKRALDPALPAAEVAAARGEMEDATFRRDRLAAAVEGLNGRLRELQDQEEQARRRVAYEALKAERDALAEELAQLYPPLAVKLVDLLTRIKENNRQIEFTNEHNLPRGAERLLVAELVARGLLGFVQNSVDTPQIVRDVRLPAFQRSLHEPYTWPR